MKTRLLLACAVFCLPPLAEARADAICDGIWHWIDVGGTECLDGTQTGFEYVCFPNLGHEGPLLIYLEGGGACGWDSGQSCTCNNEAPGVGCWNSNGNLGTNHYDKSFSCDGEAYSTCLNLLDPEGANTGTYAAFNGPTSAFNNVQSASSTSSGANWNTIHIPYCTGDVHAGNAIHVFALSSTQTLTAHFKGFRNVGLDLEKVTSLFKPSRVALWGDSAGAVGVDCNLKRIVETFPQTQFSFSNSDGPIRYKYDPLLNTAGLTWGAAAVADGVTVGVTCPLLDGAQGWDNFSIKLYNKQAFPAVRQASTEDYSDSVVNGFATFLGCTGSGACGLSCDVEPCNSINDLIPELADNPNNKFYYHPGICHVEVETDISGDDPECAVVGGTNICTDCNYDSMTRDGVMFRDWVRGWIGVPGFSRYWRDVK